MKMMRNLLFAMILQFVLTVYMLWKINTHGIFNDALNMNQIIAMVLPIASAIFVLMYIMWFDRNLLDVLIDREFELRSDVFNQEEAIRNHEIFRDVNMIKVLAQNNKTEALNTYIMEELDGY